MPLPDNCSPGLAHERRGETEVGRERGGGPLQEQRIETGALRVRAVVHVDLELAWAVLGRDRLDGHTHLLRGLPHRIEIRREVVEFARPYTWF